MVAISKKICYKTVAHSAKAMIVEKKSKFIASVFPVENEEEALQKLNSVKSEYPDARHHVYAYVIDENNIFRYSDDGEPGGTAGMPVLDTIRKEGLVDVLVVVTRYFGGTLLGTGGLVHAYGQCARHGLLEAEIVNCTLCNVIGVKIPYDLVGRVQHKISAGGYILENTVYDNDVTFMVCCRMEDSDTFTDEMTELTNGRAACKMQEQKYIFL